MLVKTRELLSGWCGPYWRSPRWSWSSSCGLRHASGLLLRTVGW